MNEVQMILTKAFDLVSAISVNGDNVEIMAEAKNLLRAAFAQAGEMTEKAKENSPEEQTEEAENG